MPSVLSQEQIDHFHEFGYCAPVDVMSEAEAHTLKAEVEAAEQRYPDELGPTNRNNPHLAFQFIDAVAHHPVIVEAVCDLMGPEILLYGSVLFFKEPNSKGFVSWHQDCTYMGLVPHAFVTPWLALTPSNPELGCIKVIPGSHKGEVMNHSDTFGEDNILTRGQAIQEIDESKAVDLILKPGQMSMHHAKTVHGSMPNQGDQRRMGIALQCYMRPDTRQVIGTNFAQIVRGCKGAEGFTPLPRPVADMDDAGRKARQQANTNWANILYDGASTVRDY
ncbi:MAG: phytanoyl-CoA dioxygenase family protein [Proteobacteria bacterium]|jgi:ectoine hydroxylase-related dioxygenase (phytanoyl-CoA dioxygenase family)|nr:phytanoyl-CoA dioxygenase family protein [Pseudomonadota bacterium]MBT7670925.1 phytanoyl-CoA dioxygenase family protein [Pseudomonadota bacterium]